MKKEKKEKHDLMEDLNEEIERRIDIMEQPDYEFVPELKKSDFTISAILIVVCIAILVVVYNVMC